MTLIRETPCRSRSRGFSLLELVVTIGIAGTLIFIIVALQSEMFRFERTMRLNLMTHPEPMAVLARVRKDVLDATGYPASVGGYEQSPSSLLVTALDEKSEAITIVYDFSGTSTVKRIVFDSKGSRRSEWKARGVPRFVVKNYELPDGSVAVRLQGFFDEKDKEEKLISDQIVEPRRHN